MLGDLSGARVLDLFAGTGAIGLEALSRGAAEAVCVERARPALDALRRNAEALGAGPRLRVEARDVARYLLGEIGRFHVVFADPPWSDAERFAAAVAPRAAALLEPGGVFLLERAARGEPPGPMPGLEGPVSRRHGDALLVRYDEASSA